MLNVYEFHAFFFNYGETYCIGNIRNVFEKPDTYSYFV